MQTLSPNHVAIYSSNGGRRLFAAGADTNASRGAAIQEALALMASGDSLLCGPGTFAFSNAIGVDNTSIIGVPGRTIWTAAAGETAVRFHMRTGMYFEGITSDKGTCFQIHSEGGIAEPTTATGIKIVNCQVIGGEDCIYIDEDGVNYEIDVIGGFYKTQNSPGNANDVIFLNGTNVTARLHGVRLECTGAITGGLNMVAFGMAGVGSEAHLNNCEIYCHPTSNPVPQTLNAACVVASDSAKVKLNAGCRLITVEGGLTGVFTAGAYNNGQVELCRGIAFDPYDVDLFYEATGGTITTKDDFLP